MNIRIKQNDSRALVLLLTIACVHPACCQQDSPQSDPVPATAPAQNERFGRQVTKKLKEGLLGWLDRGIGRVGDAVAAKKMRNDGGNPPPADVVAPGEPAPGVIEPTAKPLESSPKMEPAATNAVTSEVATASSAVEMTPNPALKGRLGRIMVAFPKETNPANTRIDICTAAEPRMSIRRTHGNCSAELLAGNYVVYISNRRINDVEVVAGSDTRIRAGVLRTSADKKTRFDVLSLPDKETLVSHFGSHELGLPVGKVQVRVLGQSQELTINDGAVTDF